MERKFKTLEIDRDNNLFVNGIRTSLRAGLMDLACELQNVYDGIFKNKGSQVIELLGALIYSGVKPCELTDVIYWLYQYYQDACITLEKHGIDAFFGRFTRESEGKIVKFPSPFRAGKATEFKVLRGNTLYAAKQAYVIRWEEDNSVRTHFTCPGCNANTMVIEEKGKKHQVCEGFSANSNPKYVVTI